MFSLLTFPRRGSLWRVVALAVMAGLLSNAVPALAQNGDGNQNSSGDTVKIEQVDTSHFPQVSVWVLVTDAQGNPVPVSPGDIQLVENGQPVQVTDVKGVGQAGAQTPISVVLTIDRSGSMNQGGKLDAAKAAANKFVDLMRPQDKTAVVAFNTQVDTLSPLTSDQNALHTAINGIQASNNTAMYDGLAASTALLKGVEGRRAIIVLSDGLDNSSKATSADILKSMQTAETSVYAIGLGDPSQGSSQAGIDEAALKSIADQSRGAYAFAPDPAGLQKLYSGLSSQLQNEYELTYTSGSTLRDGVNRGLEVRLQNATVDTQYNPGGVIPETSGSLSWLVFGGLLAALVALLAAPGLIRSGGALAAFAPKKKSRVKLGATPAKTAGPAGKKVTPDSVPSAPPGKTVRPDSVPSKPRTARPSIRVQNKRS